MKNKLILLSLVLLPSFIFANNLKLENLTRPAADEIKFDISWENSWYINEGPSNWDAAWVFIKYQDCEPDIKLWRHVKLSTTSSDHSISGSILKVDAVDDGVGVFIRRKSVGQGHIPLTSVTLKFQSAYDLSSTNFEVMAIEMVFVPEGSFYVGGISGSENTSGSSKKYCLADGYEISSEAAIGAGVLNTPGVSAVNQAGYVPAIPADFPKGYNSFYMMKYEITQEQWVRFLNLLTPKQQETLTGNSLTVDEKTSIYTGARSGIQMLTPQANPNTPAEYMNNLKNDAYYNNVDDGQNVAKPHISWTDLLAYLDWSGLRPMTELEFEKACRGTEDMLIDVYAWGTADIEAATSSNRTNANYPNEGTSLVPTYPKGVACFGSSSHYPYRVGFAATSSSTRLQAGASYYGIMELSGNLWEQAVSVGYSNSNIAAFTGGLGDGELDIDGNANTADWDLDPVKSIVKGGSYSVSATYLRVSDRANINSETYNNNARHDQTGGRGVRQFNP